MQLTAFPGKTSRVADGEGDWVTTEEGDWVTAGGGGQNEPDEDLLLTLLDTDGTPGEGQR